MKTHNLLMLPVILCLSAGVANDQTKKNLDTITIDGKPCGPEGSAKREHEKKLNRLKNRYATPAAKDKDASVTLDKMLAKGIDTARFDEKKSAVIEGYVIDVKSGGCEKFQTNQGETCNCNTIDKKICDTHIAVGKKPGVKDTETIVVEITPRIRMMNPGKDFSTDWLKANLKDHYVRFEGWLTFDTAHINEATNTDPKDEKGKKNWRATCWEVHPVTKFTIVKK